MKLIKITDRILEENKEKNTLFVGRSSEYFFEIFDKYPNMKKPMAILDSNLRKLGICEVMGKETPVYGLTYLESIELNNALVIITDDYYKEYFEKLQSMLLEEDGIQCVYFFPNTETSYELEYRRKYEYVSLENILVFRSGPHASEYVKGMDFSDNARALFEYALSIHLNERYELVWIVNNPKEFESYKKYRNVSFLPFEASVSEDKVIRDEYYRVLCLAKFFFFTDAYGFVRNCRRDQVRIQLWHGYGYKKRLSSVPCGSRYEYMPVPSELYAELHAKEFGLHSKQMLITGGAKTDWLFQKNEKLLEYLGIPRAKKYLFWLPTYRFSEEKMRKPVDGDLYKETGLPMIRSQEELVSINDFLRRNDMMLILKLHPFQNRDVVHVDGYSNIHILESRQLLREDIQINQLLGMADALISDYSSVAVDFLILNRPMAFLLEDEREYSQSRGFIFDSIMNYLPGKKIHKPKDFMTFLDEVSKGIDSTLEERERIRKQFYKFTDGNNAKRLLEALGII